jgi:hypothetical protein
MSDPILLHPNDRDVIPSFLLIGFENVGDVTLLYTLGLVHNSNREEAH